MKSYSFLLLLKEEGEFPFFLNGNGELKIESKNKFQILTSKGKLQSTKKYNFSRTINSISEFILKNPERNPQEILFSFKNCSLLFFWGPGGIISHFSDNKFPFMLSNISFPLNFYLPSFIKSLNLCFWGVKRENLKFLKDGKIINPNFTNPETVPWFSCTLKNNKNSWYSLKINQTDTSFHIGVVEPVCFLIGEKKELNLKKLEIQTKTPARGEIWKNSFLIGTGFTDCKKNFISFLPEGKYTIRVKKRFWYIPEEKLMELKKNKKIEIKLKEKFSPDKNWKSGDAHIHSYYLDGAHSPEIIALSSKANGLDFLFLTDENPDKIPGSGEIKRYSERNKFLCLTGQEIGAKDYHLNILNNPVKIEKEEICEIIEEIKTVSEKFKTPIEIMLNHPWTEDLNKKFLPYFKSWWVIDKFNEIKIIENFGMKEWFKRLNEGRKITGLWTTDSHCEINPSTRFSDTENFSIFYSIKDCVYIQFSFCINKKSSITWWMD